MMNTNVEVPVDANKARQREIAEQLVTRLLSDQPEQLQLFEIEREKHDAQLREELLDGVRERNPGKLVLDAKLVDRYRYEAAMYGAGFHPSQFEEVTWQPNDLAGTNTVYHVPVAGFRVHHEPEKIGRSNRMWDEVDERPFTRLVPSTAYDHRSYITSKEDLTTIFESEQENMVVCKLISEDIFYEKENI